MRAIFLLAIRLGWSPRPDNRWRILAILSAAMLVTVSLAGVVAGHSAWQAQETRDAARYPIAVVSHSGGSGVLGWRQTADTIDGKQYPVIAIQPIGSDLEAPLPPGLSRLPRPGQAALSPALLELARTDPAVAARYPDRLATPIAPTGLRDPGELIAYVRIADGRALDQRAVQAVTFGEDGAKVSLAPSIARAALLFGLAMFVVIPTLLLLAVAVRCDAAIRDRRIAILAYVGIPRGQQRLLAVVECVSVALIGSAAGALLFAAVRPGITRSTGVAYVADTAVPVTYLLGCVGVVVAASAILTLAMLPAPGPATAPPRPGAGGARLSPWRLAPAAAGLLCCVAGAVRGGVPGGQLFFFGLFLSLLGAPLLLGHVVRSVGRMISAARALPAHVAGARLSAAPGKTSRYLGGAMLLVLVVVISATWSSIAEDVTRPDSIPTTNVASRVSSTDARWSDADALAAAGGGGGSSSGQLQVLPYLETSDGARTVIVGECGALRATQLIEVSSCDVPRPADLPAARRLLRDPAALYPVNVAPDIAVVAAAPLLATQAVDLGELNPRQLDALGQPAGFYVISPPRAVESIKAKALSLLPAPFVLNFETMQSTSNPLATIIRMGMLAAAGYCGIAVFITVVDAVVRRRQEYGLLVAIGARRRSVAAILACEVVAPTVSAMLLTLALALIISRVMLSFGQEGAMPYAVVAAIGGLGVIFAILSAVVSSILVISTLNPAIRND